MFTPEAAFLINLDRRPDRLGEWFKQQPAPWPFPQVERVSAIDGKRVPTPPQWKNGNGAWGCYRSHLNILENCLMRGIDSYVVFEDDAGFADDFTDGYQKFVSELPDDWGLAYLGGQHLRAGAHPPMQISDHVYRPYNVNRTHAFMVRGREAMKTLYRHLTWDGWNHGLHHIDHHLGRLVQREYVAQHGKSIDKERLPTYVPDRWLCCQLPSKSNINGRKFEEPRFFNHASAAAAYQDQPFYAVLAPHRSGSSCVAMILHHLGVHMGNELGGYEGTGGGEAKGLAEICERAMKFPAVDPTIPDTKLTSQLRTWINQRRQEATRDATVAGGKYPHLCRFATHLHAALGESLRIIAVDRPAADSIDSLNRRSAKHPGQWFSSDPGTNAALQLHLIGSRNTFIDTHPDVPVLRIDYYQLLECPATAIQGIVEFIQRDKPDWQPTDEELENALTHVQPELNGAARK